MGVTGVGVRRESGSESIVELVAVLAAIVLGILALSGFAPTRLVLIALLELGCLLHLTTAVTGRTFVLAFPNGFARIGPRERRIRSGRTPDPGQRSSRRAPWHRPRSLLPALGMRWLESLLLKQEACFPIPAKREASGL
jgi:hypothetical protein